MLVIYALLVMILTNQQLHQLLERIFVTLGRSRAGTLMRFSGVQLLVLIVNVYVVIPLMHLIIALNAQLTVVPMTINALLVTLL